MVQFDNSYARLPQRFFVRQSPVPVALPGLIAVNEPLARSLGFDPAALTADPGLLTGNRLTDGCDPLAQAYAGHQFGGWSPQLGDGRALLLGEVIAPDGTRHDLALKGSGPTAFSRRGDGRAWVGPVLREYIVSEAMHAMGVPTTRALAAATTGETVWREEPRPGAVLTRVAASHIRVGTFQYFAAREDHEALELLCAHVIARHFPTADGPLALLSAVMGRQARLIAQWMALGFIHGVMNTDNMAISGETIDYGPCAFMDQYHPDKVFSSIDQQGRYAYANQPNIALWNLTQFASCLLPLMGDEAPAIAALTEVLNGFPAIYDGEWLRLFRAKIGITTPDAGDAELIETLLERMAQGRADFTRTFRGLALGMASGMGPALAEAEFDDPAPMRAWVRDWRLRLASEPAPEAVMARTNPAYIPRNHQIEAAITAALSGDHAPFHRMNAVLAHPFQEQPGAEAYGLAPEPDAVVRRTFCGT